MSVLKKKKGFAKVSIFALGIVAMVYFQFGHGMTLERAFEGYYGHTFDSHYASNEATMRHIFVDEIDSHIYVTGVHSQDEESDGCLGITVVAKDWIGWRVSHRGGNNVFCVDGMGQESFNVKFWGRERDVHVAFGAGEKDSIVTHNWSDGMETVLNDEDALFVRWVDDGITSSTVIER